MRLHKGPLPVTVDLGHMPSLTEDRCTGLQLYLTKDGLLPIQATKIPNDNYRIVNVPRMVFGFESRLTKCTS